MQLSDWQIAILNQGHWIIPALALMFLVSFPWKEWDAVVARALGEEDIEG